MWCYNPPTVACDLLHVVHGVVFRNSSSRCVIVDKSVGWNKDCKAWLLVPKQKWNLNSITHFPGWFHRWNLLITNSTKNHMWKLGNLWSVDNNMYNNFWCISTSNLIKTKAVYVIKIVLAFCYSNIMWNNFFKTDKAEEFNYNIFPKTSKMIWLAV